MRTRWLQTNTADSTPQNTDRVPSVANPDELFDQNVAFDTSLSDRSSAPTEMPVTVSSVTTDTLTTKHQAELIATRLRGRHLRAASNTGSDLLRPLAEVLPFIPPAPRVTFRPVTRVIGPTGRIRLSIGGYTLTELLGWQAGPLVVKYEGAWAVLSPDKSGGSIRRNDGHSSLLVDGRIGVPFALCHYLGLSYGDEVAVLVCPQTGVVALCDPSRLLLGAPLPFATDVAVDEVSSR